MKEIADLFEALAKPFPPTEISWRIGSVFIKRSAPDPDVGTVMGARVLAYIDARNVMERLDTVLGPGNWERFHEIVITNKGNIHKCRLRIHLPTGQYRDYEDVSDETDIEAEKGGASTAFKRAAVNIGIGRYLYALGDTTARVVKTPRGWEICEGEYSQLNTKLPDPSAAPIQVNDDELKLFVTRAKAAVKELVERIGKDDAVAYVARVMDEHKVSKFSDVNPKEWSEVIAKIHAKTAMSPKKGD